MRSFGRALALSLARFRNLFSSVVRKRASEFLLRNPRTFLLGVQSYFLFDRKILFCTLKGSFVFVTQEKITVECFLSISEFF